MAGAVALALRDAGIEYSARNKQDTGIIATSGAGSLQSDLDYYADFVKNGRTLSLANLFIYTLPSSPLGEAAIHFGLTGPLLFTSALDAGLSRRSDRRGSLWLMAKRAACWRVESLPARRSVLSWMVRRGGRFVPAR